MQWPPTNQLLPGEQIIRSGANQHGRYVVIKTKSSNHWRLWDDGKQTYLYVEETQCNGN